MAGNKELRIDESAISRDVDTIKYYGRELDRLINDYIQTLTDVRAYGIASGRAADAVDDMIQCAKQMQNRIGFLATPIESVCNQFLQRVDSADTMRF